MNRPTNKPPFIETREFRLLLETDRPERFLRPEYFRAGRGLSPAMGEQDLGSWVPVSRFDVAQDQLSTDQGPCNLSRMVLTTDAGVGKTTEMRWLEAKINELETGHAAFFVTFSKLPTSVEDLISETLIPRLAQAQPASHSNDTSAIRNVLEHLLDQGHIVLLLDALDQAPANDSAVELLQQLLQDPRWSKCRIVVSGRPHALQRHWNNLFAANLGIEWRFLQVSDFNEPQQRIFLGQDKHGKDRFELIPSEAREILSTPRVLEYLRELSDAELKKIKTASDVYWQATEHLLTEGMRGDPSALRIGLASDEEIPKVPQARSLQQARKLLGAIAFEMTSTLVVRRHPETDEEKRVPNFDGVRRGSFNSFRERVTEALRFLRRSKTVATGSRRTRRTQ